MYSSSSQLASDHWPPNKHQLLKPTMRCILQTLRKLLAGIHGCSTRTFHTRIWYFHLTPYCFLRSIPILNSTRSCCAGLPPGPSSVKKSPGKKMSLHGTNPKKRYAARRKIGYELRVRCTSRQKDSQYPLHPCAGDIFLHTDDFSDSSSLQIFFFATLV